MAAPPRHFPLRARLHDLLNAEETASAMTALTDMTAPPSTGAAGRTRPLGVFTLSISLEEFLGLSAVTELETPRARAGSTQGWSAD